MRQVRYGSLDSVDGVSLPVSFEEGLFALGEEGLLLVVGEIDLADLGDLFCEKVGLFVEVHVLEWHDDGGVCFVGDIGWEAHSFEFGNGLLEVFDELESCEVPVKVVHGFASFQKGSSSLASGSSARAILT